MEFAGALAPQAAGKANIIDTPFAALVFLAVFRGTPIRPLQLAALALILGGPLLERFARRRG